MNKPSTNHILSLDRLIGTEYVAAGPEIFTPEFFVENACDNPFEQLYKQLEFQKEYGDCLCTAYGPMTTLSIQLKQVLSRKFRLEIIKDRIAQPDFERSIGGYTSIGVDRVRKLQNLLTPNDPIRTALVTSIELHRKLVQKNIPMVTSLRGNSLYTADSRDGILDKLNYWDSNESRYGHCRTRRGLAVLDNYGRKFSYTNIDGLEKCIAHGFESNNIFIFFKESNLSDLGKIYLKGMKLGIWSGSEPKRNITRYESSRVALRLSPTVSENRIWNMLNSDKECSKIEMSCMLHAANPLIPLYLGVDRNSPITRGEVIQYVFTYLP